MITKSCKVACALIDRDIKFDRYHFNHHLDKCKFRRDGEVSIINLGCISSQALFPRSRLQIRGRSSRQASWCRWRAAAPPELRDRRDGASGVWLGRGAGGVRVRER